MTTKQKMINKLKETDWSKFSMGNIESFYTYIYGEYKGDNLLEIHRQIKLCEDWKNYDEKKTFDIYRFIFGGADELTQEYIKEKSNL